MSQKIEMIISYTTDGSDYQYHDNHGVLTRCKDCSYFGEHEYWEGFATFCNKLDMQVSDSDYCSFAVRGESEVDE